MMDLARIVDHVSGLIALGGPVVAILAGLSVVVATLVLAKLLQFRRAATGTRGSALVTQIESHARAGHSSDYLRAGAAKTLASYQSGFRILDNIAQIAPLLGLFGTVLGMIDAFQALQAAGSAVDPAALAGGIWVALLTTAAGLAVAMPTSLALAWLESRVQADARQADWLIEKSAESRRGLAPEEAHVA